MKNKAFITSVITFFIVSCSAAKLSAPTKTAITLETNLTPTPLIIKATNTVTATPTITIEAPVIIITPEPPGPTDPPGNYILYSAWPNEDLWAVNPEKPTPFFVPSSSRLGSYSSSSSNEPWIYLENNWLYIIPNEALTANITRVRAIYNYSQFKDGIDPFWFTDDIVMFLDYRGDRLRNEPDLYSLNIRSGIATKLLDSSEGGIAVVFPDEKKWIKKIWGDNQTYIVDQNGNAEKFFGDFNIDFPRKFNVPAEPAILRIKRLDKYLFIAKRHGNKAYKLWLGSNHEDPSMLFDSDDSSIRQFAVSPDERYVATLQDNGIYSYRINILSLDSLKLLYSWTFPLKMITPNFFWSPDSETLALDYSTDPVGVNNGIQIMDIKTGHIKVILKKGVELIQGWDSVK